MGNDWMSTAFAAVEVLASAFALAVFAGEWKGTRLSGLVKYSAAGVIAAAVCLGLFLCGLGRPTLVLEVLQDPSSRLFWKAVPVVVLLVSLVAYVLLQYNGAAWRTVRIWSATAGSAGLVGAAALGAVQKLPLRPLLDTNLTALVFLSLALAAASVLTSRTEKVSSLAFPAAAAFFFLAAMTGYGLLMVNESPDTPVAVFLFAAVAALTILALAFGTFLRSKLSGGVSLALFAAAAAIYQYLLQHFITAEWHFF